MDDLKRRLLETAVRPFGSDPELQLAASQLLGEQVRPDGRGAEQAIARWNEVDARTRRAWGWNRLLFWVLVSLSVAIWVPTLLGYFEFIRLLKSITSDDKPSIESVVLKRFSNRLSASQKLVLLGDCSKPTQAEKMKALWDSQSANPVYFSEYARVYLKETKQLPPNFLEIARLIDPENAWFTYLAAAVEAEGGYELTFAGKTKKDATPPPWKILNVAKLEKAAALLHEARNQPRCQDYLAEITRERIQAFPVNSQINNLIAGSYLREQCTSDIVAIKSLSEAMSAYGLTLGEAGDHATFKNLLTDTDAFVWTTSHMEATDLMEASAFRGIVATHAKHLGEVSRKLGLLDDAIRLEKIHQRTEAEKLARKNRRHLIEGREYGENGRLLASASLKNQVSAVASPPLFADRYLLPGRLADHEMVSWVCCFCAAPFLGFSLILMGMVKAKPATALNLTLAKRIGELMLPTDWSWIVGLGVLCPTVYLIILERYRPVIGLNYDNFASHLFILPWFYLTTLLAMLTCIPAIVARWRLVRRVEVFGFTKCPPHVVTLIILWNLVQFPLLGWMSSGITNLYVFCGLGFTFMICASATMSASLIDIQKQSLASSTLNLFLNPASALAAIPLLCLIPVFKATQQQAFQQDQISKIDPAFPAASPYECRVAAQMQKETRTILGDEK